MTEPVDHDAWTQAGPTQLAPHESGELAYSSEIATVDYQPASNVRVGLIAVSILAVATLIVVAVWFVDRQHREAPPVAAPVVSTIIAPPLPLPPATITTVVMPAPTAITRSPVPSQVPVGTPDTADPTFIARMQAQGWEVKNTALMALRAHQVCGALQQGATPAAVVQHLLTDVSPPPWSNDDINLANGFVTTAMRTYSNCP